jgi:hypothetical protein
MPLGTIAMVIAGTAAFAGAVVAVAAFVHLVWEFEDRCQRSVLINRPRLGVETEDESRSPMA